MMTNKKQENDPNKTNSLLRTATSAQLGASKTALTAMKSNSRPPIQKVRVPSSNESRVSELSTPIEAEMRPAMVKEVAKVGDVDVSSHIIDGSTRSEKSPKPVSKAFEGPTFRSKISFGIGAAMRVTPQPASFPTKLMKVTNAPNKSIEIQKGIIISAPSPMSLDRVQVQLGQERVLPESKESKELQERNRKEKERAMKEAQYQRAKLKVKEQLQTEVEKEIGEGFEAQLEDFDPATAVGNQKMLVQQIIGKIKPNMDSPSHVAEARFLARRALHASKKAGTMKEADGLMVMMPQGSPKFFPVSEILMGEKGQKMDDGSISTIGNPQLRAGHVVRQQVDNTNALIDQIDSATAAEDGTEAAIEKALHGGCEVSNGKLKQAIESPIDCSIGVGFLGSLVRKNHMTPVTSRERTELDEVIDADAVFSERQGELHRMEDTNEEEQVELLKVGHDAADRYAVEDEEYPGEKEGRTPRSLGGKGKTSNRQAGNHHDVSLEAESADFGSPGHRSSNISCTDFDPSPGVICGAVPLYFMYSTQQKQSERSEAPLVSKNAESSKVAEVEEQVFDEEGGQCKSNQSQSPETGRNGHAERNGKRDKVMLDKDDAYWDTLSTIASTRGLDYEKFAPTPTVPGPGPIPIEITTNKDSEEKKTASTSKKERTKDFQSMENFEPAIDCEGEGDLSLSYSHATADHVKKAQSPIKTTAKAGNKMPLKSSSKLIHPLTNIRKPQKQVGKDEEELGSVEESSAELLLAVTRSGSVEPPNSKANHLTHTVQKINQERSVTWGFEEIYEAQRSDASRLSSPKEASFTTGYHEEQELLSRTLQLSKDLLASLAQEDLDETDDEVIKSLLSLDVDEVSQAKLSLPGQTNQSVGHTIQWSTETSHESPIDVEKLFPGNDTADARSDLDENSEDFQKTIIDGEFDQQSGSTSNRTPEILSKLDVLRSQRAAALARFQSSRTSAVIKEGRQPELRERNHVKFYQGSRAMIMHSNQDSIVHLDGRDDMESESSQSGESYRTTPSKKARELRRQLDEALHASREIRRSQEKLGNDLQAFKSRFSHKNGELEDQAIRAMNTSPLHHQ